MMKYAVLLHQDEAIWANLGDAERQTNFDQHDRFSKLTAELGITRVVGRGAVRGEHGDDDAPSR